MRWELESVGMSEAFEELKLCQRNTGIAMHYESEGFQPIFFNSDALLYVITSIDGI